MKTEKIFTAENAERLTRILHQETKGQKECERDKEFMHSMNEYTEKAGLLSDDPYFGSI